MSWFFVEGGLECSFEVGVSLTFENADWFIRAMQRDAVDADVILNETYWIP